MTINKPSILSAVSGKIGTWNSKSQNTSPALSTISLEVTFSTENSGRYFETAATNVEELLWSSEAIEDLGTAPDVSHSERPSTTLLETISKGEKNAEPFQLATQKAEEKEGAFTYLVSTLFIEIKCGENESPHQIKRTSLFC